jgi:hypothetical protein
MQSKCHSGTLAVAYASCRLRNSRQLIRCITFLLQCIDHLRVLLQGHPFTLTACWTNVRLEKLASAIVPNSQQSLKILKITAASSSIPLSCWMNGTHIICSEETVLISKFKMTGVVRTRHTFGHIALLLMLCFESWQLFSWLWSCVSPRHLGNEAHSKWL